MYSYQPTSFMAWNSSVIFGIYYGMISTCMSQRVDRGRLTAVEMIVLSSAMQKIDRQSAVVISASAPALGYSDSSSSFSSSSC